MSNEIGTPAERVARGVAWLDATVPEWWNKVVVRRLRMENPCRCVLGQIFEDAADSSEEAGFYAAQEIHPELQDRPVGTDANCTLEDWLGFDFYDTYADPGEPAALQSEWSRVVAERQAGGP